MCKNNNKQLHITTQAHGLPRTHGCFMPSWEKHTHRLYEALLSTTLKVHPSSCCHVKRIKYEQSTLWHITVLLGAFMAFRHLQPVGFTASGRKENPQPGDAEYISLVAKTNTQSPNDCLPGVHYVCVCVCVCVGEHRSSVLNLFCGTPAKRRRIIQRSTHWAKNRIERSSWTQIL